MPGMDWPDMEPIGLAESCARAGDSASGQKPIANKTMSAADRSFILSL